MRVSIHGFICTHRPLCKLLVGFGDLSFLKRIQVVLHTQPVSKNKTG